ncbi:MAG: signal peptidase II [Oscillospiraceae bacterium]|nr:signal peptidase II [Oscillospiraceae bacterium]
MLYAIVAMLVIILDQWVKLYVSTSPAVTAEGVSLIPGVLRLMNVKNDGAAFGFLSGSNATIWFIVIAGVFTVLVILALATRFINGPVARWAIVLVTAGGISNCMDRVINFRPTGYVQDMFQFEFAPWFPVFNVADVFITVFAIVFILAILFGRDRKSDEDELVDDEEEEDEPLDVEEEEEEEEVAPRRGRKSARRKAAAIEDEDEEEVARPSRSSRKARQAKYDAEYEAYKAAQLAAAQQEEAPAPAPVVEEAPQPAEPAAQPADPFAEWERANAAKKPAKVVAPVEPAKPVAPAQPAKPDRSSLAADPQYTEPAKPAAPARPASRPAAKPAPVEEPEESFSLDDILAEFK